MTALKQKTSPAGIALITSGRNEKCFLEAYRDPKGIWTVGYGHTGGGVTQGLRITQARAEQLLASDLNVAEDCINLAVYVPLTQPMFDALVCLVFNIGVHAFRGSTLLVDLNQGEYQAASLQFSRWCHAGGAILPGLVARRSAEREMFLSQALPTGPTQQQQPAPTVEAI